MRKKQNSGLVADDLLSSTSLTLLHFLILNKYVPHETIYFLLWKDGRIKSLLNGLTIRRD
jgi:hypothetical protein